MATVKLIYRSNKLNNRGEGPIMIRIVHNRKMSEYSTKKYVKPNQWDDDKMIINHPSRNSLNAQLVSKLADYNKVISKLIILEIDFTISDIKRMVDKDIEIDAGETTLINFLKGFIEENPEDLRPTTMKNYHSTLSRVEEFDQKVKLKQVNEVWLQKFEKWLRNKKHNLVNTIHSRLKIIRKIIKVALRRGYILKDPFVNFKLKTEKSQRAYLLPEELDSIRNYKTAIEGHKLTRDMFLFMCYTGLRFSDLCTLKATNILNKSGDDYILSFQTSKTSERVRFQLPKPSVQIMKKYLDAGKTGFLFPLIKKTYKDERELKAAISSANAYHNKLLKRIVTKLGIEKNVSAHVARHTFAVISLRLGISMEVLSKLLGHQDLKVTQIYGKIIDKSKDDAMELWNKLG